MPDGHIFLPTSVGRSEHQIMVSWRLNALFYPVLQQQSIVL
jgi:3-polyprenyl-4-hydroxybenzoate decarboxylase